MKMKANCTYKFSNVGGFKREAGASVTNSRIADVIQTAGGTIRPTDVDKHGVYDYILGNGELASNSMGGYTCAIYNTEFKFFEKVAEGYPEPVEDDSDFVPFTVTINNPAEARNAIRMLEKLLK